MTATVEAMRARSGREGGLRILVLSRSYPSELFPTMGLWAERPTVLLAERCEVRVVSPVPYFPPLPELGPLRQFARFRRIPTEEKRNGVPIVRPRFLVGPGNTTYDFEGSAYYRGVVSTVDRIRREWPFDLIQAHFTYADGIAAARLARRYDVPFVITEHAPWQLLARRPRIRHQIVEAAHEAAALLAVSTYVRDGMQAELRDGAPISVVPVGVDGDLFRLGAASERRADQILFVGFLNNNKGIDVLFRAMLELHERGSAGRLLLVGGSHYRGTRLEEDEHRRLAAELRLDDRVEFLGSRPPEEVARLMRESAVVVLASRAETFGSVLVEALACGTPVVATRCGGPADIVDESVGVLVPVDDPLALAGALEDVLANPQRYEPDRLRAYALERFSWESIVEEMHSSYLAVTELGRR